MSCVSKSLIASLLCLYDFQSGKGPALSPWLVSQVLRIGLAENQTAPHGNQARCPGESVATGPCCTGRDVR